MKQAPVTHIEVIQAKGGKNFGMEDGSLLTVLKETQCFFFIKSHSGKTFKVSKHTKRLCNWGNVSSSPIFNI
jgi:hypothetical protein